MKKHKTEIIALVLLLGVLCFAYNDSNISGYEEEFTLNSNLLSMREVTKKEDITMEMLALPTEELLKLQENKKETDNVEEIIVESKNTLSTYNISLNLAEEVESSSFPYNEIISNQIINYALKFVGNPYVYGGNSLTNGTDCSGFTKLIYGKYGINLPRSAPEQAYSGTSVGLNNIMPGDIVLSGYNGQIGHVAIYIGDNKLVHALNENVGIVVTNLYIMPILDVRRVI